MNIKRAAIVGTGAMATLSAILLAEKDIEVVLWGRSDDRIAAFARDRENKQYLPGHPLPSSLRFTCDPQALNDPQLIISAVPCQYMRSVWARFKGHIPTGTAVVSVAKGIEVNTLLSPTNIIVDCIGPVPVACLSGPSIAPEVAARKPATVVVASKDAAVVGLIQACFATKYFRVYGSEDLVGVELAGAVKNVIAIAAGIADGIEAGDNAKASLVTRGLVEITRLGMALGASEHTFRGLAGVGDLVTTAISKISRNRSAGERIGRGVPVDEVLSSTRAVIEGVPTTRSVLELAAHHDVEMPIVSGVASVLFDGVSPIDAIDALMMRPLRGE